MAPQIRNMLIWIGAVVAVVMATVLYQPEAAKTGSLMIWMNNRLYVMDIDTLVLSRIGSVGPDEVIAASPGCSGDVEAPCWVLGGQRLYQIDTGDGRAEREVLLPVGEEFRWSNADVTWSPDGIHLAYAVLNTADDSAELRLYDASRSEVKATLQNIDPAIPVVWTAGCRAGLNSSNCQVGIKTRQSNPIQVGAYTPKTGEATTWEISAETIFALRWASDNTLLYSQPPRHFFSAVDNTPAFNMPAGGQLANMSLDAHYTVFYQPFTIANCQATDEDDCLHLGVWISERGHEGTPNLIYNQDLDQANSEGLSFIPTWSTNSKALVFFQNGRLIYYDLTSKEATIWYKPVQGKLRSVPLFSPNEEAVAFVDNQGHGFSEYRLVVVNPKLQPVEHIIETDTGFRLLAWLPQ